MSDGRHVPPGDRSYLLSIGRHLAGAAALVLVVASAFWGIGQVRTETGDPVITEPTSLATEPADQPTDPAPTDPAVEPTTPVTTAPTAPTIEPTDEPTEAVTAEPTAPAASPQPAAEGDVDPAAVRVQILDAVLDDGGEAAARVRDELEEAGYRIIATNKAVRPYEQTTVFYTEGNQAAAEQLAARFGFDVVEPKPDNLSEGVEIHLVVGMDA